MPALKERVCQRCGKSYMPTGSTQKYCQECRIFIERDRQRKKRENAKEWTMICAVCGKEFHTKIFKKTCSEECKRIYRQNTEKQNQKKDFIFFRQTVSDIQWWHSQGDSLLLLSRVFSVPEYAIEKCLAIDWHDVPEEGIHLSELMAT